MIGFFAQSQLHCLPRQDGQLDLLGICDAGRQLKEMPCQPRPGRGQGGGPDIYREQRAGLSMVVKN